MEKSEIKNERQRQPRFLKEALLLVIKLMIFAVAGIILLTYVFGLTRNASLNMQPAFRDGDLVMYYRLDRTFTAGDVIVIRYREKTYLERVIASAGDTVDITADGLSVNGSLLQEPYRRGETTPFEGEVTFPLTVPEGELFVLGDDREQSVDSRMFGCVRCEDVGGKVVGLFRRRNF